MPKLDLTTALQIKGAMGELAALKGAGFAWVRPAVSYPRVVVSFYDTANAVLAGVNTIDMGGALTASAPNLIDTSGASTGISLSISHTGSPVAGTADPGMGANESGRINVPAYAGQLLAAEITVGNWYITASVTGVMDLSGLVPNAEYEIGVVGSRGSASDTRTTVVTVGGQTLSWNATQDPPQEYRATVTASASGTLQMVLSAASGTAFAYLAGLSLQRLDAPPASL